MVEHTKTCSKYFTSRVKSTIADTRKHKRQLRYLEAIETLQNCTIYYGHYLAKKRYCQNCGYSWETFEEKMTDVNISVELINDAFNDNFDAALLISGDSDLSGPVEKIRQIFPNKRMIIGFPPCRNSIRLKNMASAFFTIGRKKIADSQFPENIKSKNGYVLRKPDRWR
ncbi:MAG: NYN domain-containing protein [Dissulfuribacterales bacterium]